MRPSPVLVPWGALLATVRPAAARLIDVLGHAVDDLTGQPASGAIVRLTDSRRLALANANGVFYFSH